MSAPPETQRQILQRVMGVTVLVLVRHIVERSAVARGNTLDVIAASKAFAEHSAGGAEQETWRAVDHTVERRRHGFNSQREFIGRRGPPAPFGFP